MVSFKHLFTSGKADGTDSTLVRPTDWNAEHKVETAAANVYLGRDASGPGPVQELPISAVFPAASVIAFAGQPASVPVGWYLCDGTVRPIGGDTALAAIIGNAYGGVPGVSFATPNLIGRVIAGVGYPPLFPGAGVVGGAGGGVTTSTTVPVSGIGISAAPAGYAGNWWAQGGSVQGWIAGSIKMDGIASPDGVADGYVRGLAFGGGGFAASDHRHYAGISKAGDGAGYNTMYLYEGHMTGVTYYNQDSSAQRVTTDPISMIQLTMVMHYIIKR